MTTLQRWIVAIIIIFGLLFLYVLKTGIEFYACTTGENKLFMEGCIKYFRTGFGGN